MRDAAREIAHFGEERIAREDPVDEPEPRGLVGREELRQKEELRRLRGPDPPRELPVVPKSPPKPTFVEGSPMSSTP